ncbi:MAG: SHOCT domain-containing protein [Actinomycetota bacterium]|nr:SHOCT domain-containing protein [Actinomycetota bacterium]
MWYGIGYGPNLWEWLVMAIPMFFIWGVLAWGILTFLGSRRFRESHAIPDRSEPEEILARRFAAGDIDEAEFDRRIEILHANSQRTGGVR